MTPDRIKDALRYQTCLCCMCRCGDHKCFQQLALELPLSMQKALACDNREVDRKKYSRQADLYHKTIYRLDYCDQPDIVDRLPLEQVRHPDNVKFNSTFGYPLKNSTHRDDFIPWSSRDQALCRAKLLVPDHVPSRDYPDGRCGDVPRRPTQSEYNYYCPPHCLGDEKPEKSENCLLGHERQFNLGPSVRRTCVLPEKPLHPFAKYSNYMLDYKGSKIPPKRKPVKRTPDVPQYPMSSETTYRDAFSCPPETIEKPHKREGQIDSLTVGDGPMVGETTSMLDYQDPDVGLHKPVRPPRHVYQPPACSMETSTTTGSTYPRWKDLPAQEKPTIQKDENTSFQPHDMTDFRRLITTYQEDFDGINSARCPCRVVEKYGPKVLEPRYNYKESDNLHDMFCFSNATEARNKNCPHG